MMLFGSQSFRLLSYRCVILNGSLVTLMKILEDFWAVKVKAKLGFEQLFQQVHVLSEGMENLLKEHLQRYSASNSPEYTVTTTIYCVLSSELFLQVLDLHEHDSVPEIFFIY